MWRVARVQNSVVGYLLVMLSMGGCTGKIAPFGAFEQGTEPNSEFDSNPQTAAGSDSGTDLSIDTETGLMGQYFRRYGFKDIELCRHDKNIDFDWTDVSAEELPTIGGLFVTWDGWVTPEFSETYTFQTVADDGVRLWINGQLIIEDWYIHYDGTREGTAALLADVPAEISLEYFSVPNVSLVNLSWASASQPQEIIPGDRYTSGPCSDPPAVDPPAPVVGTCLHSDDFSDGSIDPVWQLTPLGPVGNVTADESNVVSIFVQNGYYVGGIVDSCAFLSQPVVGDVDVSFRVESMDTKAVKAEMGIMMRNSTEPDASMVFIGLTGFNTVTMVARHEAGAVAESLTANATPSLPYWARLVRTDNLFEAYISGDGTNWQFINSVTVPLNDNYLVGIAQSSQVMTLATGKGGRFVATTGGCK